MCNITLFRTLINNVTTVKKIEIPLLVWSIVHVEEVGV